ncbi:cytidylyltransferase domain-containing protein [Patulibacter sp.]|uniref:cytidylyltransferase domain-containing protein n=1 Tax=Patulibacter sp. TaxID=1912859 RepID=UPI002719332C|nr:NTP transferase domain-containing protein [Patulibacter sp.]MDO9408795.1 NTP transferase domain-containing protein [Patulibacter sp.]
MSGSALAVVQARASSSRLPGKVLADVHGEPMLALMLRRLEAARSLGGVVLATSDERSDDPVAALGAELGVAVHRGPLDDVLARFVGALADRSDDDVAVRLTGDCPLIDPAAVDAVVALLRDDPDVAYVQNVLPRSVPDGSDAEAFRVGALRALAAAGPTAEEREHVTLGLRNDPGRWPAAAVPITDATLGPLRWTVDTAEDMAFVREVVGRLGPRRHEADTAEIRRAVTRAPSLAEDGLRG